MGQHNILDQELIYFIHTTWYNFCIFDIIILCSEKYDCIWTWNPLRMLVFVCFSIEYTLIYKGVFIVILFFLCLLCSSFTDTCSGRVIWECTPFAYSICCKCISLNVINYYDTDSSALNQWVLTICTENRVSPGRIQMEQLIPMEFFWKKGKEGITFSQFYQNDGNFVPFVWITSARLYVERNRKIYWYFVTDTTQSHSHFGGKKITVQCTFTFQQKIFIESSIKMVSAQCLQLFLLHTYMCVYTLMIWLPFQPTTEPKVDNIRMAGYMEKLPVKSNQKKVHVCSNEKPCHEYSSLIPQPHPPSDPPSLRGTSSPGEMSKPWRQKFHTDDINQCLQW